MQQSRGEVSCWWVDIKPNQIWRRLNMEFTYLNFPEGTHIIVTDVNTELSNVSFRDLSDGKIATVGRYAFYKTFTISREESKR